MNHYTDLSNSSPELAPHPPHLAVTSFIDHGYGCLLSGLVSKFIQSLHCQFGLKEYHWSASLELKSISSMPYSQMLLPPPSQRCAVLAGDSFSYCFLASSGQKLEHFTPNAYLRMWHAGEGGKTSHCLRPAHIQYSASQLQACYGDQKSIVLGMRRNAQDKLGKVTKHHKSTAHLHLEHRCVLRKRHTEKAKREEQGWRDTW